MSHGGLAGSFARNILTSVIFLAIAHDCLAAGCVQSSQTSWTNNPIAAQVSTFTATFDATPSQADIDGVMGFSLSAASGYASLAAIVRFNSTGTIDVRNGDTYAADRSITYAGGHTYHFQMVINPAAQTYSVYLVTRTGFLITIASNYGFRSEQATTGTLDNWALNSGAGAETICNMTVSASSNTAASVDAPSISLQVPSFSFGDVAVGSSTQAVAISSTGSASAMISAISISGAGFSISGTPPLAGLILAPGESATLNVTFSPSTAGPSAGSVVIASNALNLPAASIALSGSGVEAPAHSVTLSWVASTSEVIGYDIYRAAISGGPYMRQNSAAVPSLTYQDMAVAAGETYYYVVTAAAETGLESSYSNDASATIPSP